MDRRNFMKTAGLAALSISLYHCNTIKADPPNIIYILADDLGYGDLGCYGQKIIQTPNLDQLANTGVKFTQHYAGSTVCAPSRCSLFTGKHTGQAYIRGNYELDGGYQLALPENTITVGHIMKNAGYTTGVIGKWGLGRPASTGHPNNQGFDYFYGYLGQVQAHHFYPDHLWENGNRIDIPENVNDNRGKYSQDLITQKSLDFINQNKDNPFFLAITYTIPHAELLVPAEDLAVYQGQFEEKEYIGQHYHSQKYPKAAYAAMVTKMDKDIGKIKRLLEKLNIDKNSIVMFSSDNGPHKEGGNNPEFFNSNSKFRGIKRDLYEGGIRVPFIVNWPAKIKAARISDHISAFWDVLPTCADIAGTPAPSDINGISFLPELLGKKQSRHQYLYWEFPAQGGRRAVRRGKWKAVQYDIFTGNDKIELYNLETDPGEENNLAQSHPEIVAQLKKIMREVRTPSEKFPFKNID